MKDRWVALDAWIKHVDDVLAEWNRVKEESLQKAYQ